MLMWIQLVPYMLETALVRASTCSTRSVDLSVSSARFAMWTLPGQSLRPSECPLSPGTALSERWRRAQ